MTIFSYPHPSACKHYISISLDFIMSECLILNTSVWRTDSSFIKSSLDEFWLAVGTQFPTISEMAWPLPFCTMCIYDDAFSALVITKSKYQSIQKTINNALCQSVPNFQQDLILCAKQAHQLRDQVCFHFWSMIKLCVYQRIPFEINST